MALALALAVALALPVAWNRDVACSRAMASPAQTRREGTATFRSDGYVTGKGGASSRAQELLCDGANDGDGVGAMGTYLPSFTFFMHSYTVENDAGTPSAEHALELHCLLKAGMQLTPRSRLQRQLIQPPEGRRLSGIGCGQAKETHLASR